MPSQPIVPWRIGDGPESAAGCQGQLPQAFAGAQPLVQAAGQVSVPRHEDVPTQATEQLQDWLQSMFFMQDWVPPQLTLHGPLPQVMSPLHVWVPAQEMSQLWAWLQSTPLQACESRHSTLHGPAPQVMPPDMRQL